MCDEQQVVESHDGSSEYVRTVKKDGKSKPSTLHKLKGKLFKH